jgi:ketol-acid reductoisomerase
MATIHRDGDLSLLDGTVAVVGYGSQGHAHALNLRDSGVDVVVGLREGSGSRAAAEEAGLEVRQVGEAVRGARVVAILVPDHVQKVVWDADVRASRRAPPSSSRTASTCTSAGSSRPPSTT